MNFLKIKLFVLALIMFGTSSAFAALSYDVTIDTSDLNNTYGYLYFQYGGMNSVDSTAILHAVSGGTLDSANSSAVVDGSTVTGMLPGTVVFANTNGTNDYNHGITFGNTITFGISFAAPNFGGEPGGSSTFSLGLYSDEAGYNPLLGGTLFAVNLINDGSTTTEIYNSNTTAVPTPIPAAALLFGSGLIGLAGARRRMKK